MRLTGNDKTRTALAALLVLLPTSAGAQDVVMRRPMPDIKHLPATDPRDVVAPCDPATETCVADNATNDYGWLPNCGSKPPTAQCYKYDRTAGAFAAGTEAECASAAAPSGGFFADLVASGTLMAPGSKPTIVQLYAKCGIRDVYDKGWSVDCETMATPVCIKSNTYAEDTQQANDSECLAAATEEEAGHAREMGLVPTGPKPDMARMCGTKATVASVEPWRTYNSTESGGLGPLGPAYVCNGRAGRIIRMSCSYQGATLPSGGQDCDYQTSEFIADQRTRSSAEFQNVGNGMVVETRYQGEDPLLFATCTWRRDPGAPHGSECVATNYQGGGSYELGEEAFANRATCSGGLYMLPNTQVDNRKWINFLGDGSSGLSGARSYCQGQAQSSDPNDPYNWAYFTAYAPNACGGLPNPGANNRGQ